MARLAYGTILSGNWSFSCLNSDKAATILLNRSSIARYSFFLDFQVIVEPVIHLVEIGSECPLDFLLMLVFESLGKNVPNRGIRRFQEQLLAAKQVEELIVAELARRCGGNFRFGRSAARRRKRPGSGTAVRWICQRRDTRHDGAVLWCIAIFCCVAVPHNLIAGIWRQRRGRRVCVGWRKVFRGIGCQQAGQRCGIGIARRLGRRGSVRISARPTDAARSHWQTVGFRTFSRESGGRRRRCRRLQFALG